MYHVIRDGRGEMWMLTCALYCERHKQKGQKQGQPEQLQITNLHMERKATRTTIHGQTKV